MTAADDKVAALVAVGCSIRKVPWSWDKRVRSAAAAVLRLYGITHWETREEAQERIQRMARER